MSEVFSENLSASEPIAVIKIGGSILTSDQAYRRAAEFVCSRHLKAPEERLVVVVSAQEGTTDSLQELATRIVASPKPAALDLLWSTGELRSVALLTLHLHALGMRATGLNIHEAGLIVPGNRANAPAGGLRLDAARLSSVLENHAVAVVPGFFATNGLHSVVSLGRGGSDLTAVLLAAGLGATCCELIKDVPGYFTSDPHKNADAVPVPFLTFEHALALADEGCDLVQRKAIEVAARHNLPLVVRSLDEKNHVSRIVATLAGASWPDSIPTATAAP